ncbi:hypothetical protein [Fulvivirga ligni]|uniref:hypothetical protein n=1 Tax=Fulvivirga ligni TaxID=2904246 RepID=UPI001F34E3DC|nr:hypothetical protein [Fulvivirga ligni]UII22100.1 hypothetical protein LVD16_02500 [Fulvivirga ligni]
MKIIYSLFICLLFGISACQETEELDIYVPNGSKQEAIILEVKNTPASERNYADFLQLAIAYAESGESSSTIEFWLKKSFDDNSAKACETVTFMKANRQSWKIISQYKVLVDSILEHENCSEGAKASE